MSSWKDDYREALRAFVESKGRPVKFTDPDNEHPMFRVSTYGWCDYEAFDHILRDKCTWTVDQGAAVEEQTYSEFQDTYSGNKDTVGTNVTPAHCACGKYKGMTLRVKCSFGEMLKEVLPPPDPINL